MPGTPKQFNTHRFPDANHQPKHLARLRKEGANERQAAYDLLTLEQKIAKLPAEPHATKQRARLQAALLKSKQPKAEPKAEVQSSPTETSAEPTKKQSAKKYMKGAK